MEFCQSEKVGTLQTALQVKIKEVSNHFVAQYHLAWVKSFLT